MVANQIVSRTGANTIAAELDAVYGFRYYGFADNLGIQEHLTSIDPLKPHRHRHAVRCARHVCHAE